MTRRHLTLRRLALFVAISLAASAFAWVTVFGPLWTLVAECIRLGCGA